MRTAGVVLIFAAITLRALVRFAGLPQRDLAVVLLTSYGLLLLIEPWVINFSASRFRQAARSAGPLSGIRLRILREGWLPLLYLLVQFALVFRLLLVPPHLDFLAGLLIPLSLQAVLFFGRRAGFVFIGAFTLALPGPFMAGQENWLFALAMTTLFGGLCFLFGGYAHQVNEAEKARGEAQNMLGELQVTYRKLQGYAAQVEDLAVEQERSRMARELHDSVTQMAFSMNLSVQTARLLLEKDPAQVAAQLERLETLAASANREIQALVSQLRPRSVVEGGLPVALRRLAGERQARDELQVTLEVKGERTLPEPVAIGLYRIAQEALNNVAKHSGTNQATIRLNLSGNKACLEIEDHGLGFEPDQVLGQRGRLGLAGMAGRARELGWNVSVDSQPGAGTRIRVVENSPGSAA